MHLFDLFRPQGAVSLRSRLAGSDGRHRCEKQRPAGVCAGAAVDHGKPRRLAQVEALLVFGELQWMFFGGRAYRCLLQGLLDGEDHGAES